MVQILRYRVQKGLSQDFPAKVQTRIFKISFCLDFPFSIQFRQDYAQHGDEAGHASQDIGNGFSREYAVSAHPENIGKQVGQRDHDQAFAQQGEENCVILFAQGFEDDLSAVLKDHKDKCGKIKVKTGQSRFHKRGIRTENTDHEGWGQADQDPHGARIGH